ncbi:MAG: hypothetical protein WD468_02855, partial [Pirellulales bacterium]
MSDSWFDANNWSNLVPSDAPQKRARIQSTTDLEFWPVIKDGETVNLDMRVQAPLGPLGGTTYARLTILGGGTFNAGDDFRFAEDNGFEIAPIVGSLNVAGTLTISPTSSSAPFRLGASDYTTLDVDVTGTITAPAFDEIRIGTGTGSSVDFAISGNGLVTVPGTFSFGAGTMMTLSDDGALKVVEGLLSLQTKIDQVIGYVTAGRIKGLTDTYSGSEELTSVGNGVAYYTESTTATFVSIGGVPALDGDYNGDGMVDAADYVMWRSNVGQMKGTLPNDSSPDDPIGISQYELWTANFGAPSAAAAGGILAESTIVPEGSSIVLLGSLMLS